ncbi:MAG TPA: sigma-70 family RNA polymerase sigma factor [Labilithrix sp.]|jgi:RNA polymerase sigma factor (sigma-70 family)|nr:sigma-70 family RNA polymerase sigma factor [Labilithrix sp.]
MASDFDIRGPQGRFPPTRRSALTSIRSDDPAEVARAFECLVQAYWRPVYAHLRLRWGRSPEDARDLTQDLFARALEKRHFTGFDASKARFRTYLKASVDHLVIEADRRGRREKRGGTVARLSLDFDDAELAIARSGPRDPTALEASFETEWTRSLFGAALAAMEAKCRSEGKAAHLAVFRRYVIDPELGPDGSRPSYAELASELGLSVTDVTNRLTWARRTFRELVLDELREITATEDEFKSEARAVLGIDDP